MKLRTEYIKNEFLKKWLFLLSARLLPIIMLFFIALLYSRHLGYTNYGKYQSIWMYSNVINVIMGFGFTTLILSSNSKELDVVLKQQKKLLIKGYSVITLLTLLVFFFTSKFNISTTLLLILFSVAQNISIIRETYLIKYGEENRLFFINSIYSMLFFGWHLFVLYYNYDLDLLITGILFLLIIKSIALRKKNSTEIVEQHGTPISNGFLQHWFYVGLNDITGVFSKWIDKLFLYYLFSPAAFAIYFNGSFEIPLIGLLITVGGNLLLVEISGNRDVKEKVIAVFNKNYHLLSAIVFPVFFFLFFEARDIFVILFDHKYDASIPIFLITLMILPIRINNYGALLNCFGKGKAVMAGSLIDIIIVIILMIILYPMFSSTGVAIAVVAGTYAQITFYLFKSAEILEGDIADIFPFFSLFKKFVVTGILFFLLSKLPLAGHIQVRLILGSLLTILMIVAGLLKFNRFNTKISYGDHQKIQQ